MSKIAKMQNDSGDIVGYLFACPGCKESHAFNKNKKMLWEFNGDFENPTLKPSYRTWGKRFPKKGEDKRDPNNWPDFLCHSFIRDGKIQFLNDCTHELKGKTVELPSYLEFFGEKES